MNGNEGYPGARHGPPTPGHPPRVSHPAAESVFALTVPARADQLPPARHRLTAWLCAHGVWGALCQDVVLATDEAMANSAEHGYCGREPGEIALRVELDAEAITVTVADRGSWKAPMASRSVHRGRGLRMIETLAEHVDLIHDPDGTVLTARFPHPRRTPAQSNGNGNGHS